MGREKTIGGRNPLEELTSQADDGLLKSVRCPDKERSLTPLTLALVYNAAFATALAWLLWLFALSRLPAGITGLAMLATPVVSILAAWLQLGEIPEPWEAAGMGLILAALALLSTSGWRRMRGAAPAPSASRR